MRGVEVTAKDVPQELLQQEVQELTDLLRYHDSFADFRDTLAASKAAAFGGMSWADERAAVDVVLLRDGRM
jgi:hypothetical protein